MAIRGGFGGLYLPDLFSASVRGLVRASRNFGRSSSGTFSTHLRRRDEDAPQLGHAVGQIGLLGDLLDVGKVRDFSDSRNALLFKIRSHCGHTGRCAPSIAVPDDRGIPVGDPRLISRGPAGRRRRVIDDLRVRRQEGLELIRQPPHRLLIPAAIVIDDDRLPRKARQAGASAFVSTSGSGASGLSTVYCGAPPPPCPAPARRSRPPPPVRRRGRSSSDRLPLRPSPTESLSSSRDTPCWRLRCSCRGGHVTAIRRLRSSTPSRLLHAHPGATPCLRRP